VVILGKVLLYQEFNHALEQYRRNRADVEGNMGIANDAVKLMDDNWWVGQTGAEIAVEVKRVTDHIKAWLGPMVPELMLAII
jgi:hypothetical protein